MRLPPDYLLITNDGPVVVDVKLRRHLAKTGRCSYVRVNEEGCRVQGLDMFGGEWQVLIKMASRWHKAGDTAGPIAYKQEAGNSFA
jgi:hypothetical protein